jgi:hypothetical protein
MFRLQKNHNQNSYESNKQSLTLAFRSVVGSKDPILLARNFFQLFLHFGWKYEIMILSLYHNRNKMKNYQELSQKYFKKEDRVEDAADALMIIMSNLSDIQGQIVNDFDPDLVADRLNDLKEFVSDVKRLEWQLQ